MTTTIPLPRRLTGKPTDHRGFVVPFFVQWFKDGERAKRGDGAPDFRVVDSDSMVACVAFSLCWICGAPLGSLHANVIGPMCAVTRTASEPGSHRECAEYAMRVCPFLTRPAMRRNSKTPYARPIVPVAGEHIEANPGVMALWITKGPSAIFNAARGQPGTLFQLGDPAVTVRWFREGREATRAEVESAMERGIAAELKPRAEAEGEAAARALAKMVHDVRRFLPSESAP